MRTTLDNWIIEVGKLKPGERLSFDREHVSVDDIKRALTAQYGDQPDIRYLGCHGQEFRIGRVDNEEKIEGDMCPRHFSPADSPNDTWLDKDGNKLPFY